MASFVKLMMFSISLAVHAHTHTHTYTHTHTHTHTTLCALHKSQILPKGMCACYISCVPRACFSQSTFPSLALLTTLSLPSFTAPPSLPLRQPQYALSSLLLHITHHALSFPSHPSSAPRQSKMLARACDVRLPLQWDDDDFHEMANVIVECLEAAVKQY